MMLKFLQSIINIPTKLRLFDQIIIELEQLKQDKQQLIKENYRVTQNFERAILKIQSLREQDQSAQPETPLTLDETFDSNDLETIDQLVQEFNQ